MMLGFSSSRQSGEGTVGGEIKSRPASCKGEANIHFIMKADQLSESCKRVEHCTMGAMGRVLWRSVLLPPGSSAHYVDNIGTVLHSS